MHSKKKKSRLNSPRNKLIVLLNLSGSYKGGAQRRYLALFSYLQKNNRNDYFLLLNNALYDQCFKDHILTDTKNVLSIRINYGMQKSVIATHNQLNTIVSYSDEQLQIKKLSIYNFLGAVSSFLKQFKSWLSYSIRLIRIIKKFNIGVIYAVFTGGKWSWQVARLMKIKIIYSYNDSTANMVDNQILKIFSSEYYPLKYADKVDFLSEGILEKLKDRGLSFSKEKVLISPNSFVLYKNYYPEYPKNEWIVFSARLTKIKNPQLLIEAVSILMQRNFNEFNIYFLGDGVLLPELVKQKSEFKLENVFIIGGVSDTAEYLRKSKIFVSLQRDNNYPSQSLLEAMACENAIIASDVGETRKLITEKEGVLVSLNSVEIADAIQFLLANPAECKNLGENGRKKVLEQHNIEKYSKYFFEITN